MRKVLLILDTFAVLAMAILIFGFSAQPAEKSGALSQLITEKLMDVFYPAYWKLSAEQQLTVFQTAHLLVRKCAHFTEYFGFGFLLALWFRLLLPSNSLFQHALYAAFLGIVYAVLDEWHQSFVGGRQQALFDVIIDSSGVLIGSILLCCVSCLAMRRANSGIQRENKT